MTDGDKIKSTADPKGDEGGKQTQETKEAPTPEGEAPTSLLGKTTAIVERLETANKKTEENLARQERLQAESLLGGTIEGKVPTKVETEDEKWAKGAKERYAGTGMDPTPDDTETTFI